MKTMFTRMQWQEQKWRWILPILLVSLFLATLLWLPWQAQRMEANERQEQLIADTLWVEQAIQFQFTRNEEILRLIGNEIINNNLAPYLVLERFRALTKSNREIKRIDWFDQQDTAVLTTLENAPPKDALIPASPETRAAYGSGKMQCLAPNPETGQRASYTMRCHIPLMHDGGHVGSFVVEYRLSGILEEMVPWWFAQENEIALIDSDEKVYADRSAGGSGKGVYVHNRTLDFPGQSLILRTNSYKSEPKLLANLLVLSVILLSIGLIWSLAALWRDINRRLAAEGALRQQLVFRAAMENSLVTGLRARDMEGRLTYVNPAFCKMIGYPAEQLIGRLPPMPYWAPEAIEEYRERFTQILAGTVAPEGFETIYQRADGKRFPVLIYESPLVNEEGRQTGWMSSILDISELKRAQELSRQQEEKLHASARLATMGELASMLAHELNQPLAAISSYTTGAINMMQAGCSDTGMLQQALEKAKAQAQRAGHIIRSVHEFVKKREPTREQVYVSALIHAVMPLIELQAQPAYVTIDTQIAPGLPPVLADRVLLEQVLLNLTRNAIEAMHSIKPERRLLRIVADIQEGDTVAVAVIDQGHGIAPEVAEHLFSPFFSTKSGGMGMGLNICRTAIEFHGGTLTHQNNPAGGTIFRFALPITKNTP
jgi:two-component system sensor histidine kinase DctS